MIDILNTWDTNLFLFLNGAHNRFFDAFMYLFSDKWIWVPFYAAVVFLVIKKWKKQSIIIILALVLCIVIADQISSGIIKGLVERPRPSRDISLDGIVHTVNNYKGGRFGFVSSHAANSFGFALLSTLLFRYKPYSFIVFAWALITAYSRIYLGVHYPLDILGGILVGFFAAAISWLLLKTKKWWTLELRNRTNASIPIIVLLSTVLAIAVYSFMLL